MRLRKIHNNILTKLKLVRISENEELKKKYINGISLDKMELENKFNTILKERDRKINKLVDKVGRLEIDNDTLSNKIRDFPAFLKELTPAQINALYYEMITTVRNTSNMRHLFGIWFKRMINAIQTMDYELMQTIRNENDLYTLKEIAESKHNTEKFSERSMG